MFGLGKKDELSKEKKFFRCKKFFQEGHYTEANIHYCCDKCCSDERETSETCGLC